MAKPSKAAKPRVYDADYTITGLVVIVAVVIVTAMFFAQPNVAVGAGNIAGQAYAPNTAGIDALAPGSCEAASYCDGSRLIRQSNGCKQYEAFCTRGCSYAQGQAQCNS